MRWRCVWGGWFEKVRLTGSWPNAARASTMVGWGPRTGYRRSGRGEVVLAGTECGERLICPGTALQRRVMAVWLTRALNKPTPGEPSTPFAERGAQRTDGGRPVWNSSPISDSPEAAFHRPAPLLPRRACDPPLKASTLRELGTASFAQNIEQKCQVRFSHLSSRTLNQSQGPTDDGVGRAGKFLALGEILELRLFFDSSLHRLSEHRTAQTPPPRKTGAR